MLEILFLAIAQPNVVNFFFQKGTHIQLLKQYFLILKNCSPRYTHHGDMHYVYALKIKSGCHKNNKKLFIVNLRPTLNGTPMTGSSLVTKKHKNWHPQY